MNDDLGLPPVYRLVKVSPYTDAAGHALRLLREGAAEDGTLVWSTRENVFDCAVVLAPEEPVARSLLVVYAAVLGLADALAATVLPGLNITFAWPNVIEANERRVGHVEIHVPEGVDPEAVPEWMLLVARVAVMGGPEGDVELRDTATSLHFEGSYDVTSGQILTAFSRHFLVWVNRWLDDGFGPLKESWVLRRTEKRNGVEIEVEKNGLRISGTLVGLNDSGDLILRRGRTRRTLSFLEAMLP